MTAAEFLAWQWSDYPAKHRSRANLAIHVVAVPLFMLGCAVMVLGVLRLAPMTIASGLGAMIVSVVAQGLGHRLEAERSAPFHGFADFLKRFFAEQWVTFPRFIASGRFLQALTRPDGS